MVKTGEENSDKRKEQKKRERARKFLRDSGILPPFGTELNEEQQLINEQISNNDFTYVEQLKKSKKLTKKSSKPIEISKPTSDEIFLWHIAKEDAKNENKIFNITPEDIKIPKTCPYFGIELTMNFSEFESVNYCTIDLLDESKGYVKGNVQVISKLSKNIKNQIPTDYLLNFAKNILSLHKKKSK
jgi:hypothetical protein